MIQELSSRDDEGREIVARRDLDAFFRIRLDVLEPHHKGVVVGLLLEASAGMERALLGGRRRFLQRERAASPAHTHCAPLGQRESSDTPSKVIRSPWMVATSAAFTSKGRPSAGSGAPVCCDVIARATSAIERKHIVALLLARVYSPPSPCSR